MTNGCRKRFPKQDRKDIAQFAPILTNQIVRALISLMAPTRLPQRFLHHVLGPLEVWKQRERRTEGEVRKALREFHECPHIAVAALRTSAS